MPITAPRTPGGALRASYDAFPVTPSDGADLPTYQDLPCVGLQVLGAGNVAVQLTGGGTATLTGLAAGQIVDVAVKRVLATGTTATGIFRLHTTAG
ncbi:MAG TPA: hypothetical protein VFR90_03240 [Methylibium sp.]|uniref:spike base protein, RCAP_Rcc01079 family n=1 Tax=Methylibium sp. TaxID=2067992 RepID=UPI002DB6E02B|nr:hypothetical protein [Methylibium sp.]HEU4458115.1 hypothetical protein [Methylibium sp.]